MIFCAVNWQVIDCRSSRSMNQIITHYDNLKVSRNAPPEVIRAAYKILSQKYHPDRNPNNPDCVRIMSIINSAYETLSDPVKRKEHDRWIEVAEIDMKKVSFEPVAPIVPARNQKSEKSPFLTLLGDFLYTLVDMGKALFRVVLSYAIGFGGLAIVLFALGGIIDFFSEDKPKVQSYAPQYSAAVPIEKSSYKRPKVAPNGAQWPKTASYVGGFKKLNYGGLSSVKIDNGQNDSDVYVKLVDISYGKKKDVRHVFIPAFKSFTLTNVRQGLYDVRYKDLSTGGMLRTEEFTLTEAKAFDGTRYSQLTMTLYKVANGNMQTVGISESEF